MQPIFYGNLNLISPILGGSLAQKKSHDFQKIKGLYLSSKQSKLFAKVG